MTSLTYTDTEFNQVHQASRHGVAVCTNQNKVSALDNESAIASIDWAARSKELLNIFNDDSKPAYSGKFGTVWF